MSNPEIYNTNYKDKWASFEVSGEPINLLFRHLGIGSQDKEGIEVNLDVVAQLFERLEILDRNPLIPDGNTRIIIDHRSLKKRLLNSPPEAFPGIYLDHFHTIFGIAYTHFPRLGKEEKRYLYLKKWPNCPPIFNAADWMEREFRHELQHLAHTPEFLSKSNEFMWKWMFYSFIAIEGIGGGIYLSRKLESKTIGAEDIVGVGGALMLYLGYQLYRRLSPAENEARIAEGVLREQRVFTWPPQS